MMGFTPGDVIEVFDSGRGWKRECYWPDGEKHNISEICGRRGEVVSPYHRRGNIEGVLIQLYEFRTHTLEKMEIIVGEWDLRLIPPLDLLAEAGD